VVNPKLKNYFQEIENINRQRRYWLIASSLVFFLVILVIGFWNHLTQLEDLWVLWVLFSLSILISVNWWYWTMGYIRKSLLHQLTVIEILSDITYDINMVKEDVKKLTNPLEKSK
jgi:hypothetical protein